MAVEENKRIKNEETKSLSKAKNKGSNQMNRRKFFFRAGWTTFVAFIGIVIIGSIRFLFPRVLFEPSPIFKAGFPDEYLVGMVSTKWLKDYRVFLVREEKGLFAISAICTHLGCTPIWLDIENKFKCPCHGSGFSLDGINFEGPAPRPLERLKITLADDGQIEIDRSIKYLFERSEWQKPGAFLNVSA